MQSVFLFIPCIVDVSLPDIGVATVSLLRHLGCQPFYHEEQTCCGQVLYNAGRVDPARELARRFITIFEQDGVIVSPSGSCVYMVRKLYPLLFEEEPDWCRRSVSLAERRKSAFADFSDPTAMQAAGAAIRAGALEQLPELLETFEETATANGARVFWAADAGRANDYIVRVARQNGVQYVTKGKSMISEELGLNEALAQKGIKAWETDLGEFITQLLKRPPFHIVGPAINIPVAAISEIFMEKGIITSPEHDPVRLGLAARRFLRQRFHHVEMGITGVNLAVAEIGSLINVENEGNIRLSKSSPRIQVAVMSLEKIVATMADALHLIRLLCRSSTGQAISAYVSIDSGPRKNWELDGPEELHIVILDNGRTRIYQDPETRDVLLCIRCGACLNVCPIYGKIGGYPYGRAYTGPMGQILSPLLLGLDRTRDLFQACTLCRKCRSICPVGVDLNRLLFPKRVLPANLRVKIRIKSTAILFQQVKELCN